MAVLLPLHLFMDWVLPLDFSCYSSSRVDLLPRAYERRLFYTDVDTAIGTNITPITIPIVELREPVRARFLTKAGYPFHPLDRGAAGE